MRADEFIREDQKLDEVLPLIGKAVATGGGMLAKGAAKAGAGMLNKGTVKTAGPNTTQQPQTMGAPDTSNKSPGSTVRAQAVDQAKDQIIKPGSSINLPTDGTGGPEEFKVSGIQGDEVEIENPTPAPGEPRRVMYKKDDIKQSMSL